MERIPAPGRASSAHRDLKAQPHALTRALLRHALGDPEFYRRCPVFLFLRAPASAAWALWRAERAQRSRTCPGNEQLNALTRQLGGHILAQHQNNAETLRCLVAYVADAVGVWPQPLRVFYQGRDQCKHCLELSYDP